MKIKYLIGAVALGMSTATFAAEPAPAPNKECCCCKKDEQGKTACCKDKAEQPRRDHKGHDMGGMDRP
ncbi:MULTISPECIES: hypothetical protein [Pseudomonadota]|uniref:hypothetical protein n=1 Tax=Pseudomonadota TaxID=1224 RepID=UPI0008299314|nr:MULTISPECIES: hypothetical protein [Pseudomonadota]